MSAASRIVIVGGGQAAASLAVRLRSLGHAGPLTLIGDEPALPYERPPLSKGYLLGRLERERLFLRPQSFYDEHGITVITGCRVDAIDRARHLVHADGRAHGYDFLALATGSTPRRLPAAAGGDLAGTFVVRTLADVDAIAAECRPGRHALIVGGGYIGLEAAAVFRSLGVAVTLLETAPRILQRVAAPETSDYFRALHSGQGVVIREGTALERLSGPGRVTAAVLTDGSVLDVDFVVVGIGIRPAVDLASAAGLVLDNGIAVDALGRTSDPAIFAAGDCASFPYRGHRIRLESVQNAIDQAGVVAQNMLGASLDYQPLPWFWSDQFDVKLQIAGLNTGYDHVVVRTGATTGARSHWYYAGDRLLSVDAMNEPRSFMHGKRLLEHGIHPPAAAVADPQTDLKAWRAA